MKDQTATDTPPESYLKTYRILRGSDDTILYTGDSEDGICGIMRVMFDKGITIDGLKFTPEGHVTKGRFVPSIDDTGVVVVRVFVLEDSDLCAFR